MRVNPDEDAFAAPHTADYNGSDGINIRTYIATAALQGLLASGGFGATTEAVEYAVKAADALIAELNK